MPNHIRPITFEDRDQVVQLYMQCYDGDYVSFTEIIEGLAVAPGVPSAHAAEIFARELARDLNGLVRHDHEFFGFGLVAGEETGVYAGQLIGFVLGHLKGFGRDHNVGPDCWIDDMGVYPVLQGQGHGRALIEHVRRWAKTRDVARFLLESGPTNIGAHVFFVRAGFVPAGVVFYADATKS